MARTVLQIIVVACLMLHPAAAQTDHKIDVNLASTTELQKLPGVTLTQARKIVAERPYARAADLHAAGLSDAEIAKLQPLITFGRRQQEIPTRQGGAVATVSNPLLFRCAESSGDQPREIKSGSSPAGQTAVCLPKAWFSTDGQTLTDLGAGQVNDLVEALNKKSGASVSLVGLEASTEPERQTVWTRSAANLVLGKLQEGSASNRVTLVYADDSDRASLGTWAGITKAHRSNIAARAYLQPVNVTDAAANTSELILVLPLAGAEPASNRSEANRAGTTSMGSEAGGNRATATTAEQPAAPPPAPAAPLASISLGQTEAQVKASLGVPMQIVNVGAKTIYVYRDLKVTFTNGRVADVE